MKVQNLNRKYITQLKRYILNIQMHIRKDRKAPEEDLANADKLVSDEQVFRVYGDMDLSKKDFEYKGI